MPVNNEQSVNQKNYKALMAMLWLSGAGAIAYVWVYLAVYAKLRSATLGLCQDFNFFSGDCDSVSDKIPFSDILKNTTAGSKWFNNYNTDGTVNFEGLQKVCLEFIDKNCRVLNRNTDTAFAGVSDDLWQLVAKCDPVTGKNLAFIIIAAIGTAVLGLTLLAAIRSLCIKRENQVDETTSLNLVV